MKKVALLIHGWPQPIESDSFYWRYFEGNGYEVVCPYLFNRDGFDLDSVLDEITKELAGRTPAVILGFSLGGLILPHVANNYPKAKLVMIATATRFYPDSTVSRNILKALRNKQALAMVYRMVQKTPDLTFRLSQLIDPMSRDTKHIDDYLANMQRNIAWGKKIPLAVNEKVLEFVLGIDNAKILASLKNDTLVFAGRKDKLMPVAEAKKICRLVENSRLVETGGSHFNLFTEKELEYLDEFLGN